MALFSLLKPILVLFISTHFITARWLHWTQITQGLTEHVYSRTNFMYIKRYTFCLYFGFVLCAIIVFGELYWKLNENTYSKMKIYNLNKSRSPSMMSLKETESTIMSNTIPKRSSCCYYAKWCCENLLPILFHDLQVKFVFVQSFSRSLSFQIIITWKFT